MHPILRNTLAVITGIIFGSFVNMGFVNLGASMIPAPDGVVLNTMEGLKASMHLMEPKNFLFPWIAHAFGTLAGAAAAARLGASHQMRLAMGIGAVFLFGGISMVVQLPSPVWFTVLDLVGAYLPMAWLGYKLAATRIKPQAGEGS